MSYKLQIGTSAAVTFESLGIENAELEADVEGRSFLTLETSGDLGSAAIIAPFQSVTLLDAANTVRFKGWLDEAPRTSSGDTHRISYRLTGPHRWLARANFVQARAGLVILGGTAGTGPSDPQPFNTALTEVLNTALARYPSTFSYTGQGTFTHQIPSRLRADVDCHTALLSLVSFAPTLVLWWTYPDGSPPMLNFANGSGSTQKTLSTTSHQFSRADLNPRYDLLADTVKVYFVNGTNVSSEQTSASAGDAAALGANRTVLYTYDTSVLNNIPTTGIAAALASWHQTLHIDASATRHSIDWTDHAGQIYGFSGPELAPFASYKSILHTLRRNLFLETTELRLGIIAGKTLFKVNDLDQGPAANPTTHGNIPPTVSIPDVSGLQTQLDGLQNQLDAFPDLSDFPNPNDFPQDYGDLTDGLESTQEDLAALEGRVAALEQDVANIMQQLLGSNYAWRTVQRCDNKTMQVWGTVWA